MRRISLPDRRIDTHLPEHALHTKCPRLIGDNWHDSVTQRLVFQQRRQDPNKRHGGTDLTLTGGLQLPTKRASLRRWQCVRRSPTRGDGATQLGSALAHVTHFRAVFRRPIERHLLEIFIADWHAEAVAKCLQALEIQLLQGVRLIARFTRLARSIPLDRHGEDHRRPLDLLAGRCVRGIHFVRVMPPAVEVHDVVVAQVFDQFQRLGVLAKKVLARIRATVELTVLQLTVAHLVHDFLQVTTLIALNERVPLAPPNDFDDMPTRTAEYSLELLNDLAVTANRPIESLQVAVNDEMQVA